jgi:[ribosomal protein S18]-alanine N-acetyltransferase
VLKPVGPEAAAALAPIHASAFERPWNADALADVMAGPSTFTLQAGEPPAGFIVARALAGEAEILTLAVAVHARRQGLGRLLVEAAAHTAAGAGAASMWLEVAEDNAGAQGLYAAAGFQLVGRRRAYYSRPGGAVDALVLQRRLNSAPA